MNEHLPAWMELGIAIATVVCGVVVTVGTILYKLGKFEAHTNSRLAAIDEKVEELKDCGKAEHQQFYGRLNKLDQKVAVLETTQNRQGADISRLKNA